MLTLSPVALAILLVAVSAAGLAASRRTRRRSVLGAALLLATLGAMGVRARGIDPVVHRVVLVDVSTSVAGEGEDILADPVALVAGLSSDDRVAVFTFAGRPHRVLGWTRADGIAAEALVVSRPDSGPGTDLAGALQAARAELPGEGRRDVVVFTDGRSTVGNAAAAVEALRADGIRVTFRALGRRGAADMRVSALRSPLRVHPGQPFEIRVEVEGPPGAEGKVKLRRSSPGGTRHMPPLVFDRSLRFGPGGRATLAFSECRQEESGLWVAGVSPASGVDPIRDNDGMAADVRVLGPPVVLVLRGPRATVDVILRLRSEGVLVREGPFNRRDPPPLVVLVDRPVRDVPRELASAVAAGTGLLVVGGVEAFESGGYAGTWLEALLPLKSRRDDDDGLLIAILVDVSGSMNEPFSSAPGSSKAGAARRAVSGLVEAFPPGTRVVLIPFSERIRGDPSILAIGTDDAALSRLVESLERDARGGTDLGRPLARAAEILAADRGRRHVVIVSDGEVGAEADVLETLRTARDDLRRAGVTIGVIVTGGDVVGRATLRGLAGEGSFQDADDPDALARGLLEDLRRKAGEGLRVEGPARVRAADALAEDEPLPMALSIDGWLRTWTREGARVVLEAATDPSWPVLAVGRHGLGRTAAIPTSPRFGEDWGEGFWSGLVRRLVRTEGAPGLALRVEREEDGRFRVVLTSRDAEGRFRELDRPRLHGGPDLARTGAGRYEAVIADLLAREARRPGLETVSLTVADGEGRVLLAGPVPWPLDLELSATGPDADTLRDLAALAGVLSDRPPTGGRDVSSLPLLLAALLVVVDAALKLRRTATDGPVAGETV